MMQGLARLAIAVAVLFAVEGCAASPLDVRARTHACSLAGQAWTEVAAPAKLWMSSATAGPGPCDLWLIGYDGTKQALARSRDAGATYQLVQSGFQKGDAPSRIRFQDSAGGWILGTTGSGAALLLRTTDGGETWRRAVVPPGVASLSDLTFSDGALWLSGGWRRPGAPPTSLTDSVLLVSYDGGATWQERLRFSPAGPFTGPQAEIFGLTSAGRTVMAAAYDGRGQHWFARSTDNGRSFTTTPLSLTQWFWPAAVVGDGHAVVMGGNNIAVSADGGGTWSPIATPHIPLMTAHFDSPDHGYVVGATSSGGSSIDVTNDGGRTWENVFDVHINFIWGTELRPQDHLMTVTSTSGGLGYAVSLHRVFRGRV